MIKGLSLGKHDPEFAAEQKRIFSTLRAKQDKGTIPTVVGWSARSVAEQQATTASEWTGFWRSSLENGKIDPTYDQRFLDIQEEKAVGVSTEMLIGGLRMVSKLDKKQPPTFSTLNADMTSLIIERIIAERIIEVKSGADFVRELFYVGGDGLLYSFDIAIDLRKPATSPLTIAVPPLGNYFYLNIHSRYLLRDGTCAVPSHAIEESCSSVRARRVTACCCARDRRATAARDRRDPRHHPPRAACSAAPVPQGVPCRAAARHKRLLEPSQPAPRGQC